jgi:5'-nucleotidase
MNRFAFLTGFATLCCCVHLTGYAQDTLLAWIQLNDVYEIEALSDGTGGLARVAGLRQDLHHRLGNTLVTLSGDFLNPSVFASVKLNGKPVKGKQMIAVLNASGLDLATFGNHEFDLDSASFHDRLNESTFRWVSSNVKRPDGTAFRTQAHGVIPGSQIVEIPRKNGKRPFRVGVLGVTLDQTRPSYVNIQNEIAAAQAVARELRPQVDQLVALTHLTIEQDRALARALPDLALLLGGHEHEAHAELVGNSLIFKSEANARRVYVHYAIESHGRLYWASELVPITNRIPLDPRVALETDSWVNRAYLGFRGLGFEPTRKLCVCSQILDGQERVIRSEATALGRLIAEALRDALAADLALVNSGSIRVDDRLSGALTEFDILRTLPFGGSVELVQVSGQNLLEALNTQSQRVQSGSFLQLSPNVRRSEAGTWLIHNQPITAQRTYRVALTEYVAQGKEARVGQLGAAWSGNRATGIRRPDIRKTVIQYLARTPECPLF